MGTTTNWGLPYPEPTDPVAAGADDIKALANAIDPKLVGAVVGITKVVASSGTVSTTETQINPASVTWTANTARRYKITISGGFGASVVADVHQFRLRMTSVTGAIVATLNYQVPSTWGGLGFQVVGFVSGVSGTQTAVLTLQRVAGTGTVQIIASAALPTWIWAEDAGLGTV